MKDLIKKQMEVVVQIASVVRDISIIVFIWKYLIKDTTAWSLYNLG